MPVIISGSGGQTFMSATGSFLQGPTGLLPVVITGSLTVTGSNSTIINYGGFVSNAGGDFHDFRVETQNMANAFFVDGEVEAVQIGASTNAPAGLLEINQSEHGHGDGGLPALLVVAADIDQIAVDINASQVAVNVVDITADAVTSANVIDITADALTTGGALHIDDDSANTGTRNTVEIIQNNAAATGATALKIQSDSGGSVAGLHIDRNSAATTANDRIAGIVVDLDQTGEVTSATAIVTGMDIEVETNSAADGTINAYGQRITMTGDTDGTHSHTGLSIRTGVVDTDTHIELLSAADTGDKCTIAVGAAGVTTITTVDEDAAVAHLTMAIDGDITMKPAAGNVTLHDGSNDVFDFDVADPAFKIMDDAQVANYCSIAVGANGATTFTTVDADAAIAHLTFTVDGGIKLDGAGVEIENASATGAPALLIDNDDTDQIALNIDAANIDANVINITANALTSGDGISVASSTTDTTARALLKLSNSNSAAVATIPIEIVQADVAEGDIISAAVGANGSICALRVKEASVTCSTGDVTTESTDFFPALSIPVALGIRVTTAITNNAFVKKIGWQHDANAFAGSDDGSRDMENGELEAAGTTTITAGGMNLVFHENSDLLITHNATPSAGVLRIAYYYYSITAPTS